MDGLLGIRMAQNALNSAGKWRKMGFEENYHRPFTPGKSEQAHDILGKLQRKLCRNESSVQEILALE